MRLKKDSDGGFFLSKMEQGEMDALRHIAIDADLSACPELKERLFSDVLGGQLSDDGCEEGEEDAQLRSDWSAYVKPDLELLFGESLATFLADLDGAERSPVRASDSGGGEPLYQIHVPADHVMDWYRALNQARLAIHAIHGGADGEVSIPEMLKSGAFASYLRDRLYVTIQEWIVGHCMAE